MIYTVTAVGDSQDEVSTLVFQSDARLPMFENTVIDVAHKWLKTKDGAKFLADQDGIFCWDDLCNISSAFWKANGLTLVETEDYVVEYYENIGEAV